MSTNKKTSWKISDKRVVCFIDIDRSVVGAQSRMAWKRQRKIRRTDPNENEPVMLCEHLALSEVDRFGALARLRSTRETLIVTIGPMGLVMVVGDVFFFGCRQRFESQKRRSTVF